MFTAITSTQDDDLTIVSTIAINLSQVAFAKMGTPDKNNKYITYRRSAVRLVNGDVFYFDQEDETNHDFMSKVFGANWEQVYLAKKNEVDEDED
jgi:hypothetical protein